MTAGEVTGGEVTAGEVAAGEVTAGEVAAGEVTGGEGLLTLEIVVDRSGSGVGVAFVVVRTECVVCAVVQILLRMY